MLKNEKWQTLMTWGYTVGFTSEHLILFYINEMKRKLIHESHDMACFEAAAFFCSTFFLEY